MLNHESTSLQPWRRIAAYYRDSFSGFRREVWMIAVITFVNRAGSMVIPFLSLYLTKDQGFSLTSVGWVMTCFGLGSVVGSWAGGKLADLFGFYRIMVISLAASGIAFISLQYVHGFVPFCVAVFFATVVVESFRPAMFVSIRHYADPTNRTRAVTLVRLAINLGFSMGPAIGGLIISYWSYGGLFWVDGLSCLCASGLLLLTLRPKTQETAAGQSKKGALRSPYRDLPFMLSCLAMLLISIPFLQYFSTMPIFYREQHALSESTIGIVLGMNGLLIFLFEMPLIKRCEELAIPLFTVLRWSSLLIGSSFFVVVVSDHVFTVWLGMALVTLGEMLNFPMFNRFVYDRADQGQPGAYMSVFTMTWSVAHICGHALGLNVIEHFGFAPTWLVCAGFVLIGIATLTYAELKLRAEESLCAD